MWSTEREIAEWLRIRDWAQLDLAVDGPELARPGLYLVDRRTGRRWEVVVRCVEDDRPESLGEPGGSRR